MESIFIFLSWDILGEELHGDPDASIHDALDQPRVDVQVSDETHQPDDDERSSQHHFLSELLIYKGRHEKFKNAQLKNIYKKLSYKVKVSMLTSLFPAWEQRPAMLTTNELRHILLYKFTMVLLYKYELKATKLGDKKTLLKIKSCFKQPSQHTVLLSIARVQGESRLDQSNENAVNRKNWRYLQHFYLSSGWFP